jgi:molecular chaperone GrpE
MNYKLNDKLNYKLDPETNATDAEDTRTDTATTEAISAEAAEALEKELDTVKAALAEKNDKCDEYLGMLQRTTAEFENYKKRTAREKESLYSDSVSDVVTAFLPIIDSVEKAILTYSKEEKFKALKEGMELIDRQIKDVLKNISVEEIKCLNECFDPRIHNGVMHVEDDAVGQNIVIEECRKGYIYKDKVIRHSMVKVAN